MHGLCKEDSREDQEVRQFAVKREGTKEKLGGLGTRAKSPAYNVLGGGE